MEYGLWNFHGGFWPGGNAGSAPPEAITRNFYNSVNTDVESSTFHPTSPAGGDSIGNFTTGSASPPCQQNLRTQTDFIAVKDNLPVTGRVSVAMTGHHNDQSQSIAQQIIPMTSDMVTEQSSMESLASTDSPLPSLMDSQQSQNSSDGSPIPPVKKEKNKNRRSNGEDWGDANGHGTNLVKSENNPAVDYLFQQSYPHQMYGVIFTRMSGNKREQGTSDETDEEDDEIDEPSTVQSSREQQLGDLTDPNPNFSSLSAQSSAGNLQRSGYECGECGLVADTRPGLKKHIAVCHPAPNPDPRLTNAILKKMSATAKCPMATCRFRTSERNEMEAHVARHVAGGYRPNGKKRSGPVTPQRVRYEREEYRCQMCAYSCTVEKAFYKHLKVHSIGRQVNQIKISCVICGKDRSSEVDMNKHMKKHRDDRYFCCDICIFKTVQLKKLIQHRRMHTGEKPHLCPHCSYRSARRDNLRSHVRRVHKKDNLFCDTFSPRGLLLTANLTTSTTTTTTTTPPTTSATETTPTDSIPTQSHQDPE